MAGRAKRVFQCAVCARDNLEANGKIDRVGLTGKVKKAQRRTGQKSSKYDALEYECFDCGFIGVSTHWELQLKRDRKGSTP